MSEPPATLPPALPPAALPAALEAALTFDAQGLVCAVAQQHDSGEVLMVAWMNRAALAETLASGRVCYWSRSRGRLWRKGETSGQTQRRELGSTHVSTPVTNATLVSRLSLEHQKL